MIAQVGRFGPRVLLLEFVDNVSRQGGDAFSCHIMITIDNSESYNEVEGNFFYQFEHDITLVVRWGQIFNLDT